MSIIEKKIIRFYYKMLFVMSILVIISFFRISYINLIQTFLFIEAYQKMLATKNIEIPLLAIKKIIFLN